MEKVFSTLDVYITAWIYLNTGSYPNLVNHKGKVSFNFQFTEDIIKSLHDYNSGKTIEALQFSQTIKGFKAQIFQIKSNAEKV